MRTACLTDAGILRQFARIPLSDWIYRWYILAFCAGPAVLVFGVYVLSGQFSQVVAAQAVLGLSTWASLRLLADRPLLNPVQTIVFLFHHWFGVGVGLCAMFYYIVGDAAKFEAYYYGNPGTILIVAAGLPLYAFIAAAILHRWPDACHARFLQPIGVAYEPRTIRAYFLVGGAVYLILFALQQVGIQAFESVNYLGGTVTTNPALAAFASLNDLANSFALFGFLHCWFTSPEKIRPYRWIGVAALLLLVAMNLFSGSKGMVISLALVPLLLYFTLRQKVPYAAVGALLFVYVFALQPFVDKARMASEAVKVATPDERKELFSQFISSGMWSVDNLASINMESPFRYMYPAADRVTPRADDLTGPWGGRSLADGASAITPRFLNKDKADSNMGNFFARELGLAHPHNFMHNVTITIPFEFVGNYGWIAGVLSFGLLALVFTPTSAWLLSKGRLATHPLTPMVILMALKIEASCGQMINSVRDFPIVLLAAYGIWIFLGRRL